MIRLVNYFTSLHLKIQNFLRILIHLLKLKTITGREKSSSCSHCRDKTTIKIILSVMVYINSVCQILTFKCLLYFLSFSLSTQNLRVICLSVSIIPVSLLVLSFRFYNKILRFKYIFISINIGHFNFNPLKILILILIFFFFIFRILAHYLDSISNNDIYKDQKKI